MVPARETSCAITTTPRPVAVCGSLTAVVPPTTTTSSPPRSADPLATLPVNLYSAIRWFASTATPRTSEVVQSASAENHVPLVLLGGRGMIL